MRSQLLSICLFSLLLISCRKDDIKPSSKDYLIFGHYFSECAGGEECIEIFKLEQNQLLEDLKDMYPSSDGFYEGDFIELGEQKFNVTKDLINNVPRDLWKERSKIIGSPDYKDQGGLYIEFKHKGKIRAWLIDYNKDSVPPKYHEFIEKVKAAINAVQ